MTAELHEPTFFGNREFAIIKEGRMWRHLQFDNIQKLRAFLIQHRPDHVYFSSAKYKMPGEKDMLTKRAGWLGSDLVFDIDNDHLEIPTIDEATYHALMLKDLLINNFGLEISLFTFSGSRGYHIHIRDDKIQFLNNHERGQICEYITGFDIDIDVPVTCDTARLIRLPGSIHGKTGKECRIIKTMEA